jgi:hypothetical protein
MAVTSLGKGKGRFIVCLAYTERPSEEVVKETKFVVTYKSGDKILIPPFACETEKDIITSVKNMSAFIKKMNKNKVTKTVKPKSKRSK